MIKIISFIWCRQVEGFPSGIAAVDRAVGRLEGIVGSSEGNGQQGRQQRRKAPGQARGFPLQPPDKIGEDNLSQSRAASQFQMLGFGRIWDSVAFRPLREPVTFLRFRTRSNHISNFKSKAAPAS